MFPADHLSIPDKEYLHHSVRVVPRHGNHIPVFHAMARDLLLLGDLLHAVYELPVLDGLLVLHRVGGRHHLFLQHRQHRSVLSVQKFDDLGDRFLIFHLGNIALARP